jgi:mannan endo-1,4-beta-mannosidase
MKKYISVIAVLFLLASAVTANVTYITRNDNAFNAFVEDSVKCIQFTDGSAADGYNTQQIVNNDGTVSNIDMSKIEELVLSDNATIWKGSVDFGNWLAKGYLQIPAGDPLMSTLKAGDVLTFNFTEDSSASWWQFKFTDSNGSDNVMACVSSNVNTYNCVDMSKGATTFSIKPTAADITYLKANGMFIKGCNLTLTSIEHAAAQTETTVWSGSTDLGTAWSSMLTIPASSLQDVVSGTKMTVNFTENSSCTYWQLQPLYNDNSWTTLSSVSSLVNQYNCIDMSQNATSYTFTINESDATSLKTYGMIFKGYGLTLTSVVISGGSGTGGGTGGGGTGGDTTTTKSDLCDAKATQQAVNVYNYLKSVYGSKELSGVMANVDNNNTMSNWVYAKTGKHPALTCYDFINIGYSWANYTISYAQDQWNNNGLVAFMWHWRPGSEDGFYTPSGGSPSTEFDVRQAVTKGTSQYNTIISDIDKIAVVLKNLQNANIPVIWRPLHEAAGNSSGSNNNAWFWWGRYGASYTKQLYDIMYDRLVNYHGIHNLIWVWTFNDSDTGTMTNWYPGNDKVDIVGTDLYPTGTDSQKSVFDKINTVTGGKKIIALAECGRIPDPDKCFSSGDKWSWFMEWYKYGITTSDSSDGFANTADYWSQIMNNSHIVTREAMKSLK